MCHMTKSVLRGFGRKWVVHERRTTPRTLVGEFSQTFVLVSLISPTTATPATIALLLCLSLDLKILIVKQIVVLPCVYSIPVATPAMSISAFRPPYGDHTRPAIGWAVVAVACVANFLDLFQSSMVLFGLPPIEAELGFTVLDINWVLVAYTVTFATFLLIGGQTADRVGLRTTFLLGTATLTWSNVLCAFTPNKSGLLAGRALAGAGAAFTVSPLPTCSSSRTYCK
jgi:hypothetical protein